MLCMNSYPQSYIDDCRTRIGAQVKAYQALTRAAKADGAGGGAALDRAIGDLEPHYFNNLLLAMDCFFVHRARALELKDGNPLNEVRMLCASLMNNAGKLGADKTIKYDPAKAVLKLKLGDPIRLSQADFVNLSKAFLAEIESKFA